MKKKTFHARIRKRKKGWFAQIKFGNQLIWEAEPSHIIKLLQMAEKWESMHIVTMTPKLKAELQLEAIQQTEK